MTPTPSSATAWLLGDGFGNSLVGGGQDAVRDGHGGDLLNGGSGADHMTGDGKDTLAVREAESDGNSFTFRLVNQTSSGAMSNGAAFVSETDEHRLWSDDDGRGRGTDGDA